MSKIYSIYAVLKILYTQKNIEKILNIGEELGLKYYEVHESQSWINAPQVLPNQAANYIVNIYPKTGDPSSVLSVYKEEEFFISFLLQNKNEIMILITITGPKEIDFKNTNYSEIDFVFYISILLKICKNFNIKTFKSEINH